ncbi:MAG: heme ABC transporter ATP-binding protein [Acidimicrobiia bacterium]
MPEPIVEANRVTYLTNGATLVADIDFTAVPGEMVAVLGPNGAGKTTLLRLLAGDLLPTDGTVTLADAATTDRSPGELSLVRSMLSDHIPVDIPFTVLSVVEMGRFPYRRDLTNSPDQDHAAVAQAMQQTDTALLAGRIFSTLSSGERTRVALARVLAQETPVVLLDEPTTALDVANRERILREAARLASQGKAVVAVLHDLNAAAYYADRLILMADSSVLASGTPRQVLEAELLSHVFHQRMEVIDHPFRDCPLVLVSET